MDWVLRPYSFSVNLLSEEYKLFKIYFDVYAYNNTALNILKKISISLEGQFKYQYIYKEQRHDVLRFALYSKDIEKWAEGKKEWI